MASRLAHVAFLSSGLTLILVLLLASATVYKAPITALTYPNRYHFRRSANPRQTLGVKSFLQGEAEEAVAASGLRAGRDREAVDIMATSNEQVKSWPQLVGLDAEEAKKKILEEHPHLQVHIVPADSFMTMDYNLKRVRIFKDANQKVKKAPTIG